MEGPMFILINDSNIVMFEDPTTLMSAFYADNGPCVQAIMIFQDPNTGFWRSNTIACKGDWQDYVPTTFILPYGETSGISAYKPNYAEYRNSVLVNINEDGVIDTIFDIPDIREDENFHLVRRLTRWNGKTEMVSTTSSFKEAVETAFKLQKDESCFLDTSILIVVDSCVIAHLR